MRIQSGDLYLSPIADGRFACDQQLVAAAITGDIDIIERVTHKIQITFQRQRADITIPWRDMPAGKDLGLAQRAVPSQRSAGLD